MGLDNEEKTENDWHLLDPEETRADKITIASLCLQQINRINFLISLGTSNSTPEKLSFLANGIVFGIAGLEIMMYPELDNEYKEQAKPIKEKLFEPTLTKSNQDDKQNISGHLFLTEVSPIYAIKYAMEWYLLLTKAASHTNLYPTKELSWEAGVGPYDRAAAKKY